MEESGLLLRRLRTEAGKSISQLARAAKLPADTVRRMEAGTREIDRSAAERLAPHLGVRPVQLLYPNEFDELAAQVIEIAEGMEPENRDRLVEILGALGYRPQSPQSCSPAGQAARDHKESR